MATSRLGGRLGGRDNRMNINRNPYAAGVDAMPGDDFALLEQAVAARSCRERVGYGTFDEASEAFRPHPACPRCGSSRTAKDGRTPAGHRRLRCAECGARFCALSGTIFDNCKKDFATWVRFVELMTWNVPIDAAAEVCGVTHKTAFEWRHRVFATVRGYQDRIVLRNRVWIDEVYVNDTDLSRGYGQARKRGLSRQKLCIAVAIDASKNPVAVVCGHGKPSARGIRAALGSHLAEGSTVVHDKERAHNGVIADRKCTSEAYKADVTDPAYLDAMEMANNLSSWIKRYLWRFTGMDPANLQSYLDWYVYLFRVRQAEEKWPKTARVVRHLLMTDARYRTSTGS